MIGKFRCEDDFSPFDQTDMEEERYKPLNKVLLKKNISKRREQIEYMQVTVNNMVIRFPKVIYNYEVIKIIDIGSSCVVALLKSNITQNLVAAKIFAIDQLEKADYTSEMVENEIRFLSYLNHPNIIKMHEHFSITNDVNEEICFIIIDYYENGSLLDFVNTYQINDELLKKFIKGITSAIKYLQILGISHLDIKPENILIDHNLNPILTDFGFATNQKYILSQCGTPQYKSPEIRKASDFYDPLISDIWSLGVTFYVIATRNFPYDWKRPLCKKTFEDSLLKVKNIKLRDLIGLCLQANPNNRARINTISRHEYLAEDSL